MGLMKDVEFEEVEIPFEKGDKLFYLQMDSLKSSILTKKEFGENK